METFGQIIREKRQTLNLDLVEAAETLHIKKEHLEALENQDWENLPEKPFMVGFIKNYAEFLGLDVDHTLALYRREYDDSLYPKKQSLFKKHKRLQLTPNKITNFSFALAILAFLVYILIQYFSILSAPFLDIQSPQNDQTTSIPAIEVSGKTEKDAQVSIEGEFIKVDENGQFYQQVNLLPGQNTIEINASKRLSPKVKKILTIRLSS